MANNNSLPPPEIRLHEPAVDFLDNHRGEYHSSLGNPLTHYDPSLQKYTGGSQAYPTHLIRDPTQERVDAESLFSKALELLRTTPEPKHSANAHFRIRDKHSWAEVEKEVNDAKNQYTYVNGISGDLRKWLRKVGDRGGIAKSYMSLIPSGTYTSIVSGGGNMLIEAAIRLSKLRGNLETLVENLPRKLQDIEVRLQLYASERRIHDAIEKLYLAILIALEEVVRYYTEKAVSRVKSAFLGDEYKKPLEEKLKDIDEAASDLKDQAELCHQISSKIESQFQIHQIAEVNHKLCKADKTMQNSMDSQNSILEVLRDQAKNSEWMKYIKAELELVKRSKRKLKKENAHLKAEIQLRSRTPSPAPKPHISQAELVHILHKSCDTAAEDRDHCAHFGRAFKMAVQDRAAWLMRSEKLKAWLTSRYSEVRLVHGNYESAKISPVSYLCAMLAESLEHLKPTRVIHFFCGRHTEDKDPLSDAHGMIKSLLVQLFSQDTFNTSFLRRGDVQRIENNDLETLCDLFCRLVEELDGMVALFCIIDGINFFETGQRGHAMHFVIGRLVRLAGEDTNAIFKLLVASPTTTSRDVRTLFSGEEIILVPSCVTRSGYGFSDKQMAARTDNDLRLGERYRVEEDESEKEGDRDVVRGLICEGAISNEDSESDGGSEGDIVRSDVDDLD